MAEESREPCAFCPATANITGEHIWSAWAGKMFGAKHYTFTRKELDGNVLTWKNQKLNPKGNVVCSECNSGWMNLLEDKTKAVIKDMVVNCTPTTLHDSDIETIAAFGFLKAVIGDHMHSNFPPFYTFEERQSFRRTLSIPNGVQMWLASMPIQRGLFKSLSIEAPLGTPRRFALNVFTYGLGHLVIQAAGCRWKKKASRRHAPPPRLTPSIQWSDCSIPFWPNTQTPILWPPNAHLGAGAVDEFVLRWTNLELGLGW
jgi:hypothetical protein